MTRRGWLTSLWAIPLLAREHELSPAIDAKTGERVPYDDDRLANVTFDEGGSWTWSGTSGTTNTTAYNTFTVHNNYVVNTSA